jgi:hypothetical protein
MMRGLRHLTLLTCALSLVATPVLAGHPPGQQGAASKTASPPDGTAATREKALLGLQRDLVSVLALRVDSQPLLGAALYARPLVNQPKFATFHALIERAAHAEDAGAAVSWVRLADCDAKADACPNTDALDQLVTQAPDNAAVWLLKLGEDAHNMKPDAARADLAKAAGAKQYDDYTGISLKALADTVSMLPPPADTIDPAHAAGAMGVKQVLVFGLASTQPQPGLQVTAKLCENAGDDASIKTDCLNLGKILEWGSSPLGRSLGLHLREVLADDPAQQQDAKHARLNLIWQVQSFAQLSARAQGDAALSQHLLLLATSGGTEMSLLLAALRDNNIPTDAPADWKPQRSE